jgi:hypothetical protein
MKSRIFFLILLSFIISSSHLPKVLYTRKDLRWANYMLFDGNPISYRPDVIEIDNGYGSTLTLEACAINAYGIQISGSPITPISLYELIIYQLQMSLNSISFSR